MKRILLVLCVTMTATPLWAEDGLFVPSHSIEGFFTVFLFLGAAIVYFLAQKANRTSLDDRLGFLSITPGKPQKFYPITADIQSMEPVVHALADENTNVYSNLAKITLAHKPGGVYLEEKNYKISILINRRRCRRCYLNDGDIIDMGELTIMFLTPDKQRSKAQETQGAPAPRTGINRVKMNTGKMIKSYPTLTPSDPRKKTYYLTKNITYVGRSEMNDLVSKTKSVELRHAKIECVSGRYKIIDLDTQAGTFVNGRRVENKYLKDGDLISFESVKYTFNSNGRSR